MNEQQPTVGRVVHYQSYGTPNGEYKSEPRAAIITKVNIEQDEFGDGYVASVDLCVLNPTGMFFNQGVEQGNNPGQWNWPPRV